MQPGVAGQTSSAAPAGERASAMVTPEAVVLDLRTAALGSRSLAKLLDLVIIAAAVGIILLVAALAGAGDTLLIVLVSVLSSLALFGYPALWEARWRGRTPGKAALGLRVVTDEGSPIGARHAIIRAVLAPVDLIAGAESMLVSARDRRLGDLVAGTVVLRDKTMASVGPPLWFSSPPGWEAYTESLDTASLTGNEQAVIRAFLLRWREFHGESRLSLAAGLAAPLIPRLGPAPPPWLPPDLYLLCVTVARQNRDHGMTSSTTRYHAEAGSWATPAPSFPPAVPPPPGSPPPGAWGLPAGAPAPVASPPRDAPSPPAPGITPPA
ncbi:MAG: RDD family protein [Actinomycetota bacterium]|nr:RDD family protein [Actinomycetota bacterium]